MGAAGRRAFDEVKFEDSVAIRHTSARAYAKSAFPYHERPQILPPLSSLITKNQESIEIDHIGKTQRMKTA